VSASSGILLVVDTGQLHFWSHDHVPIMPEWAADEETVTSANSQVDFRIEGPDAAAAGKAFDRQANPYFLFDIPAHGIKTIQASFRRCIRSRDLNAHLIRLDKRITHRERVDLIRQAKPGGGEIIFQGIPATVIDGLPRDRSLAVVGEGMPEGPDQGRWRQIILVCNDTARISRSEEAGYVGVDYARLMFADVDALAQWQEESLDGLADFVFWGRDARKVARRTRAPQLSDTEWGWIDLPEEDAFRHGRRVGKLCKKHRWALGRDFRPHSHHYLLMKQIRETETESGTVEVGGAKMCGFMTSWGDGFFPVYRDLDDQGRLVRVRIDLGNDQIVQRQRKVEEWHFGAFALGAVVSRRVLDDGHPVCFLCREEPENEHDSGWMVYAGDEPNEYADNHRNWRVVPLRELISRDHSLEEVLRSPPWSAFARKGPDDPFERVEKYFEEET
jgi:hypothetical protein